MTRAEEIEDRESRITEAQRLRDSIAQLKGFRLTSEDYAQGLRDEVDGAERHVQDLQDQILQLESELQAVTP